MQLISLWLFKSDWPELMQTFIFLPFNENQILSIILSQYFVKTVLFVNCLNVLFNLNINLTYLNQYRNWNNFIQNAHIRHKTSNYIRLDLDQI